MNIKHTIRDGTIFLISMSGIAFVYRYILRRKGPLVRIIAFHDVANGAWFESVIQMLHEKYIIITPKQFHAKEFDTEKINVLLTFDDGYQSWIDVCLPVLTKHTIKGLFFINSGLLNCSLDSTLSAQYMKEHLYISSKEALSWEGAKILLKEGHTIGGHSVHHYNLATLDQHSLEYEIAEDKKNIESQLGVALSDFAYPFGTKKHYTENVYGAVRQEGYVNQYSAKTGFVVQKMNTSIPRTLIEKNQPISQIIRWVEGGYDIISALK